jgi:hypothetical protein
MDLLHSRETTLPGMHALDGLHIISFSVCDLACSNLLTLEHSSNDTRTVYLTQVNSRLIVCEVVDLLLARESSARILDVQATKSYSK